MKVIAVLAAVVAVAVATPSAWTLKNLSDAIQNPTTKSELKPVLEQALDIYMEGIFHGVQEGPITISTLEGVGGTFTLSQLDAALSNPAISSSMFKPYLEDALDEMMSALYAGHAMETIEVRVPAFQLSYWSLQEIDAALTDATSKSAMIPYLKSALDALMEDLINGGKQSSIVVAMPLAVVAEPEAAPSIVAVNPAVAEGTAPATASGSSPLVEIIVNIHKNDVTASTAIDRPSPTVTSPEAPVSPVDVIGVLPTIPEQTHPIDIIAIHPIEIAPPAPVNPVDVIGVLPIEALPVNPVDIVGVPIEALPPNPAVAVGPMM